MDSIQSKIMSVTVRTKECPAVISDGVNSSEGGAWMCVCVCVCMCVCVFVCVMEFVCGGPALIDGWWRTCHGSIRAIATLLDYDIDWC